jgi:hypothetical protein
VPLVCVNVRFFICGSNHFQLNSTGVSHPTIKSPEQGLSVLARFASDFRYPHPDEGYHRIVYLGAADQPGLAYSRSDVSNILQRLWDSAPVMPARIPRPLDQNPWGESNRARASRIRYQPREFGGATAVRRSWANTKRSTHDPRDSRI